MKPGSIIRKLRRSPLSPNYDANKVTETSADFTTSTCSSGCFHSDDASLPEEDDFTVSRRVRFCTKEDKRIVPNCKYMDPVEREKAWYLRDELSAMKADVGKLTRGLRIARKELVTSLKSSYNQAKFIAESGIDEDELLTVGSGAMLADLKEWTTSNFAAEACRGLEKNLLQNEREASIEECRQIVIQTMSLYRGEADCANAVATGYRELTRHSTIFAQSVATTDAVSP